MLRTVSLAVGASLAAASLASASVYSGGGFNIVDNATVSSDIVVTDNFLVDDITITLFNLTHTWAGDLTATLTHLDSGATRTLFVRVGFTGTGFGDSSDFGGNYAFNDGFANDLWAAAAAAGAAQIIPPGNYYASGAGSAAPISLLAAFGGLNANGTWRLSITDSAAGDTGALGSWGLSFVKSPVPAPGVLALMGLAGLTAGRRRRA